MTKRYMFVSYAKPDAERVRPIVKAVAEEYRNRGLAVEVWADFTHLVPGEQWRSGIMKALADSFGMLVFVSPSAMRSDWVRSELAVGTFQRGRLIIPVILRKTRGLPRQPFVLGPGIDLSKAPYDEASPRRVAKRIADITEAKLKEGGGAPASPATAGAGPPPPPGHGGGGAGHRRGHRGRGAGRAEGGREYGRAARLGLRRPRARRRRAVADGKVPPRRRRQADHSGETGRSTVAASEVPHDRFGREVRHRHCLCGRHGGVAASVRRQGGRW